MQFKISDHILYKTNQLIAFNKPVGLAVQVDKTGDKALINLAEIYTKSKIYPIHRIDRPSSGVVLFAKSKKAAAALNEQFKTGQVAKTYLAVVKNKPESPTGTLTHYLKRHGRTNRSVVVDSKDKKAKQAVLQYTYLASSERYHLLKINLKTGRHHQIRVQLGAIDSPIKGDNKYGFKRPNTDRSIHLHAWKLAFQHPVTGETIELVAPPPDEVVWNAFGVLA